MTYAIGLQLKILDAKPGLLEASLKIEPYNRASPPPPPLFRLTKLLYRIVNRVGVRPPPPSSILTPDEYPFRRPYTAG